MIFVVLQSAPHMTHRHPDVWLRPSEFLPERYIAEEDDPLRPGKNAWRTFEPGNTNCIGQELAMVELRLGLALTVRELEFDFDYAEWDRVK